MISQYTPQVVIDHIMEDQIHGFLLSGTNIS